MEGYGRMKWMRKDFELYASGCKKLLIDVSCK
jgi:hypothetical protein